MSTFLERPEAFGDGPGRFTTTDWTLVVAAGQQLTADSSAALEALCRTYWYPLYAFARRRGYAPHDAQDLTQTFFARLLEKDYLRTADRGKGKFRSFLLASFAHFLANEWRKAHTQKRGGTAPFISIDETSAEGHYLELAASTLSPEDVFDQEWATTLLDHALKRLREDYSSAGKTAVFDELKQFLSGESCAVSYSELAAKLSTTQAALKMSVSRMRHRYRDLVRAEVANTVSTADELEEEMQALFTALGR